VVGSGREWCGVVGSGTEVVGSGREWYGGGREW